MCRLLIKGGTEQYNLEYKYIMNKTFYFEDDRYMMSDRSVWDLQGEPL